jgi:hypothetical protein
MKILMYTIYRRFILRMVMNSKTTSILLVAALSFIAVAMIVAPTLVASDHSALAKKSKGTKGYYTKKGHHHCTKGSSGCSLHGK